MSPSRLVGSVLLVTILCTGCSLTATMVPVAGPLSERRPLPVLQVKVDGIMGNSGDLSFTMPDGETCEGRWSSAAGGGDVTVTSGSLVSEYGTAYLDGYSISSDGSGQNPGQAIAVCSEGRTVLIEFVTGAGTAHGFGIAKDNEDNVYRFVF